jgi:ABC-type metal ion transport system substrate-binding protein
MLRRAKQTVDPLSAQSRTLAVTSKGDLITLRNEFETDKASKDTRMNTAETDITTLQNSATGIVDGGRADVQHLEATDINGGSASI